MQNFVSMITFELTYHNLLIRNAYTAHKCKMRQMLKAIRDNAEVETIVFDRCLCSLKLEWICHKFLYLIGYERERTRDADLDNPCDHPEWEYIVCGILVWPFIW